MPATARARSTPAATRRPRRPVSRAGAARPGRAAGAGPPGGPSAWLASPGGEEGSMALTLCAAPTLPSPDPGGGLGGGGAAGRSVQGNVVRLIPRLHLVRQAGRVGHVVLGR